jgi:hypothetical protein
MTLEEYKKSMLFEPTDEQIKAFLANQNDKKEDLKGGKWDISVYENDTRKKGGDGIPELVGYNLSSVWKDITHQKSEFFPFTIKLPEKNVNNGKMSLRYSRTCLQEIERVIKTYMREGDYFLENCCGWSTFGSMAAYFGYSGKGVDIWDLALEKSREQYEAIKLIPNIGNLEIIEMDGMNLDFKDNSFDYVYCNPPFMDSEKYSGKSNDIVDKNFNKFILKIDKLMSENYRVCKPECLCTITINDYRKDGYLLPIQKEIIESGYRVGFKLWDFVIAELVKGRNLIMRKDHYAKKRTAKQHEYIITFIKPNGFEKAKEGRKK